MKILVINLGATSSKIAVYEDSHEEFVKSVPHSMEELNVRTDMEEQIRFRKEVISRELKAAGYDLSRFDAAISRGGPLKPVESGTYLVDENVIKDAKNPMIGGRHAACLGILIAHDFSLQYGFPAYLADPVSVDELKDVARRTGIKGMYRSSMFHALNQKATARKAAEMLGKKYEEANLIGVHMGGGTSIAAHEKGRVVDNFNILDEGCFSMDRPGSLPTFQIIDLCFSGEMEKKEIKQMLSKQAGVYSHLGTKDFLTMEKMIEEGNAEARAVYETMVYQQAKDVGAMAAAMRFQVDGIFLTGGIAYSGRMCRDMKNYCERLAPVLVLPGENEMESLAGCALRVLRGETAKRYGEAS